MASTRDRAAITGNSGCMYCRVRNLCLPAGLAQAEAEQFSAIVRRCGPFKRGETVYRAADPFNSLYAVQTGALKTYGVNGDGEQQVTGFHLSGELVGMDAIVSNVHPWSAAALEHTWVCTIPYDQLTALGMETPQLRHALIRCMSRELIADEVALMRVGKTHAEQRMLGLLNDLHQRFRQRLGNVDEIYLPMTRREIASYLGLTIETVSRALSRLQAAGTIQTNGRTVRIRNEVGAVRHFG